MLGGVLLALASWPVEALVGMKGLAWMLGCTAPTREVIRSGWASCLMRSTGWDRDKASISRLVGADVVIERMLGDGLQKCWWR